MFANVRTGARAAPRRSAVQRGHGQIWLVWGLIGAAVVFAALIGVGVYIGVKRQQDNRRELDALRATGNELIQQQRRLADGETAAPLSGPAPKPGDTVPARNDTELLRGFNALLREVASRAQQRQQQVAAEAATLQLDQLLSPERLASAAGRRASRAAAQRYMQLVDRSAAIGEQARSELRQRAQVLVSRLPQRGTLLAQMESSAAERAALEKRMVRNQRETAELSLQIVELIERARARVQLQDGGLAFTRQQDLDAYNGLIERVQAGDRERQRLERLNADLLAKAQARFAARGP
ncbi:hypothetical protein SAMN04487939_114106 [Lysobacter sp. yr284]|uniref:hypothetical protein n=1 Tax=Lysobacter sp. yr284 TaxID=1761791 RepID=UPI00089602E3|nr:hypothetical protein [Lysobacter sp. yr284]SDZ07371.1 hypothetical protein SAMN04487939_114106 [Lysobacter sp. yr284]